MSRSLLLPATALTIVLGACTTPTSKDVPPAEPETPASELSEADVELFLQIGDVQGAAGVYSELAKSALPPLRSDYLLDAAALLLEYDQITLAQSRLEHIDLGALTPQQRNRWTLLKARLALRDGRAADALSLLPAEQPEMTLAERADLLELRARIYTELGQCHFGL
ncbi:MAG: penicillin-binding protein activator, partial [Gammaproteobacteria bacterium]|nr:penicillin-binding protein activator [Gammaproteobacteria bacterium]